MPSNPVKPHVIAIEEHYQDPAVFAQFDERDQQYPPHLMSLLRDLDDVRLKEMDEGGVDIQVLSHQAPSTQKIDPAKAPEVARLANDNLKALCDRHPDRFAGFAALPTPAPEAAADELERAVKDLGLKGAMIHGLTNGTLFLDDKRFWPIFARAEALDVPIYIHPANPSPVVVDAYYKEYVKEHPAILTAGWGFAVETATQAIRVILSGVLDEHPKVKIILGHLGEGIPFLLRRMDESFSRGRGGDFSFAHYFCRNFYVTTSGNFSDPALLCSVQEMGADRVLFSIDWPFVANRPGTEWMERLQINQEDKEKILSGNAKRLLKM